MQNEHYNILVSYTGKLLHHNALKSATEINSVKQYIRFTLRYHREETLWKLKKYYGRLIFPVEPSMH